MGTLFKQRQRIEERGKERKKETEGEVVTVPNAYCPTGDGHKEEGLISIQTNHKRQKCRREGEEVPNTGEKRTERRKQRGGREERKA